MVDGEAGGRAPVQGDLFGGFVQPGPLVPQVDIDAVCERLLALLAELREAAGHMPWSAETARLNRVVFPQMANWLPADERAALVRDFEAELGRLAAA